MYDSLLRAQWTNGWVTNVTTVWYATSFFKEKNRKIYFYSDLDVN